MGNHSSSKGHAIAAHVKAALLMGALAFSVTAAAQDTGKDDLMEVTVTAQKRAQSLQDVPISIAVVDGKELENFSIKSFEDFSTLVPNFAVVRTPGADAIFMRGIGSGPGSPSLDQSVVMFVDGIYGGRSRQFAMPFLDIERIEVLRGPQGALVGKNTSAGAISIVSAKPTDKLSGKVDAEYDFDFKGTTVTGVVSGPMSDNFSLRFAGKYLNSDGYIKNTLTGTEDPGRDEKVGRLTGVYKSDAFTLTAKAEVAKLRLDGNPLQVVSQKLGRTLDYTKEMKSSAGLDFDTNDSKTGVVTLDWNLGEHTLTSITGYSKYETREGVDADFFEKDLAYSKFDENFKQTSQELRLLSPTGGSFDYVAGVYWHKADLLETRTTASLFAPATNTIRYFDQGTKTVSAYTQGTFKLSPEFAAVLGLRYTKEDKDASYVRIGGANAPTTGVGTTQANFADKIGESDVDPSISLQWRPANGRMIYASYSQGSKSGGFQGAISNATLSAFRFSPEKSDSFELGLKQSFGGRGYIDIVAFDTTYKDLQLSVAIQSNPAVQTFAFYTGNAGKASARGVESTGAFKVSENFRISGSLAYIKGTFDDYVDGPCATGQAPTNTARASCNLTGVALPFTPKWSGNVTGSFLSNLNSTTKLDISLTANFKSEFRTEFTNDPYLLQGSFVKFDARAAVEFGDTWELALLGRNLTDKRTTSFGTAAALAANPALGISTDSRMQVVDPPRTIAIQARYKF